MGSLFYMCFVYDIYIFYFIVSIRVVKDLKRKKKLESRVYRGDGNVENV